MPLKSKNKEAILKVLSDYEDKNSEKKLDFHIRKNNFNLGDTIKFKYKKNTPEYYGKIVSLLEDKNKTIFCVVLSKLNNTTGFKYYVRTFYSFEKYES